MRDGRGWEVTPEGSEETVGPGLQEPTSYRVDTWAWITGGPKGPQGGWLGTGRVGKRRESCRVSGEKAGGGAVVPDVAARPLCQPPA